MTDQTPATHNRPARGPSILLIAAGLLSLLALCGCLEQVQTTRIASGSLSNFLLHLEAGELDDARAYFAPGLVTPSAEQDSALQAASERVRRYEIDAQKAHTDQLQNGEVQETLSGRVRPRPQPGQPAPGPNEGWEDETIITARMVERGPGWRILQYELKCCHAP